MLHEPAAQSGKDYAADFKMKVGIVMFLLYAIFYAGFVALNVLKPVAMEVPIFLGMNLAVFYGFSLIAVALILALIYTVVCSRKEKELNDLAAKGVTQ